MLFLNPYCIRWFLEHSNPGPNIYYLYCCYTLLLVMRRVREAVHARHNKQYERKVQETCDGDDDEHFVGRVAHAVRRGVLQNMRWRRLRWPGCGVVAAGRSDQHVVPAVMPASDGRGRTNDVSHRRHGRRPARGRPSVGRCHFVVLTVVPDRTPSVCTAAETAAAAVVVVVHRRSAVAADHVLDILCSSNATGSRICGKKSTKLWYYYMIFMKYLIWFFTCKLTIRYLYTSYTDKYYNECIWIERVFKIEKWIWKWDDTKTQ